MKKLAVILIAATQVGVPAFVLLTGGDGPDRFAWQMFAERAPKPRVAIVDDRSRTRDVALPPFARRRPDLDYSGVLPRYVCDRHAKAETVIVTQRDRRVVRC